MLSHTNRYNKPFADQSYRRIRQKKIYTITQRNESIYQNEFPCKLTDHQDVSRKVNFSYLSIDHEHYE